MGFFLCIKSLDQDMCFMLGGTITNGTLRYLPYLQSVDIRNCQMDFCKRYCQVFLKSVFSIFYQFCGNFVTLHFLELATLTLHCSPTFINYFLISSIFSEHATSIEHQLNLQRRLLKAVNLISSIFLEHATSIEHQLNLQRRLLNLRKMD